MQTINTSFHNNNFNLIRLILAISVIFSHSWKFVEGNYNNELLFRLTNHFRIGDMAVDGFFLLSGYLIVASWINKPQLLDYVKRRVSRIFPAFIVVSFVSVIIGAVVYRHEIMGTLLSLKVFLQAFTLAEPKGPQGEQLNVSLWTIRYEFFCYAMVGGMGLVGLFKKNWPLVVLWVVSMGVSISCIFDADPRVSSLVRLVPYFVTGGMFYLYKDNITYHIRYAVVAIVGIIIAFLNVPLSRALLPLAGGYLLFYIGFLKSPFLAKLRPVNDISYGLYLYGWTAQKFLLVSLAISSPWLLFGISLPLTALLGLLSWKLIEEPFVRKGSMYSRFFKKKTLKVSL